jgi:hypothetical protein
VQTDGNSLIDSTARHIQQPLWVQNMFFGYYSFEFRCQKSVSQAQFNKSVA